MSSRCSPRPFQVPQHGNGFIPNTATTSRERRRHCICHRRAGQLQRRFDRTWGGQFEHDSTSCDECPIRARCGFSQGRGARRSRACRCIPRRRSTSLPMTPEQMGTGRNTTVCCWSRTLLSTRSWPGIRHTCLLGTWRHERNESQACGVSCGRRQGSRGRSLIPQRQRRADPSASHEEDQSIARHPVHPEAAVPPEEATRYERSIDPRFAHQDHYFVHHARERARRVRQRRAGAAQTVTAASTPSSDSSCCPDGRQKNPPPYYIARADAEASVGQPVAEYQRANSVWACPTTTRRNLWRVLDGGRLGLI